MNSSFVRSSRHRATHSQGFRLLLLMMFALNAPMGAAATLYVDANTGNDATPKQLNGPSTPWRTIGRAAWGSTDRNSPSSAEAAAAGDIVIVAGGTYTTSAQVNNRWAVVYNPVNSGTPNGTITFTCSGICVLGAANANGPIIGSDARNYIKWYADLAQAHTWRINTYAREEGTASTTEVNTAPDTGPVVGHAATGVWIEGAEIDGGLQTDYTDNYNGIRLENCTACTVRNNTIRNFRNQRNATNGSAVTLYGSANAVVEHNLFSNVSSGVIFKDTQNTLAQSGVHVRFNRIDHVDQCLVWSITAENRNYVYQNLCMNARFGLVITGGGLSNDWIVNNTFVGLSVGAVYLASNNGSGGKFWNNIIVSADQVILLETIAMPEDDVIDFEHNLYFGFRRYYSGSDGPRTFEDFKRMYSTHNLAAPASIDRDPQFANAAAGDYGLCMGPWQPVSSCTGSSPAMQLAVDVMDLDRDGATGDLVPAGAYVSNDERIGPFRSGDTPPSPPTNVVVD